MSTEIPDIETRQKGLLDSVKGLMSTLLGMAQTRLEILSTEIEEEREWLSSILAWTMVALFCAALAVILGTLLVVVIFWDSYRLQAIGIMMGIFVLAAVFSWRTVSQMKNSKARLFSTSIAELTKDRERLSEYHE